MARTTFSGPVRSNSTIEAVDMYMLPEYTVAELPDATERGLIYVSDGAAGSPIIAFSDGTDWLRSDTGTAVASS